MNQVVIVMALEAESAGIFARRGIPVLYTGVGKVNATLALASALQPYIRLAPGERPWILNLGTAGSANLPVHSLVEISSFIQRDMDCSPLGFTPGQTPFDDHGAHQETITLDIRPHSTCGTGDSFVTVRSELAKYGVVDMEGYALAKVCKKLGFAFSSYKYVTDGNNGDGGASWLENCSKAAEKFLAIYGQVARIRSELRILSPETTGSDR